MRMRHAGWLLMKPCLGSSTGMLWHTGQQRCPCACRSPLAAAFITWYIGVHGMRGVLTRCACKSAVMWCTPTNGCQPRASSPAHPQRWALLCITLHAGRPFTHARCLANYHLAMCLMYSVHLIALLSSMLIVCYIEYPPSALLFTVSGRAVCIGATWVLP